ncbi:hypothetical protein BKG88_04905 [Rodentibacter ratti]|uniref:Uncharacterized protein n=1 Tax=Rodentibacter ratti TaxID=1906745 RepID=A0A1V3L8B6_9PAST|nr:hypothetical protein BKG88_04905 [Rodentibacter ratti]
MLGFNFLDGNFLNSPQAAQTNENCLKIESRKGNLYGAPNLSESYFKSAVDFKFVFLPHFIRRKNKMGSLLCRLCVIEFVGNFRLFERSEFRKLPLSKFNGTKD